MPTGRLHKLGLIRNTGEAHIKGPKEWTPTTKGQDIQHAINKQTRN